MAKDGDEQLGPEDQLPELLKILVSTMITGYDDGHHGPFEMATWDVSRAYFYGEARRWIYTFLLEGHEQEGKLARHCRNMYGRQDAASIWGKHLVRSVEGWFHEGRNGVPSFLSQSRRKSQRIVSW